MTRSPARFASCTAIEPTPPAAAETNSVSPSLMRAISCRPTQAVNPVLPRAPKYSSGGACVTSSTRTCLAGSTAYSRQPSMCCTVDPSGTSGLRDATTVPIADPCSGSPTANGGTYDFASFIRPRMYGSTDIIVLRTRTSPSPGGATLAVASAKLASVGSPDGRDARRISRLATAPLVVLMPHPSPPRQASLPRSLRFAVPHPGQLAEELLLLVREVRRELADQADVFVAVAAVLELRHPFAGQAQQLVVLRAGGDRHRHLTVHRRHAHLAAQDEVVDADRDVEVDVVALALPAIVVLHVDDQEQVAARTAAGPRRALAGEPDPLAVAHAAWDRHVESLRLADAAGAVTLRADAIAVGAGALAARTRVLDLQRDLLLPAFVRVVQGQLDRRFEIFAALRRGEPGRTGAAAAADPREEHVEEVGEPARPAGAAGTARSADVEIEAAEVGVLRLTVRALLLGLARRALPVRSEDVVLLALLGIAENLVRFLDVLELLFRGFLVVRIRVRVPFPRELAVRALDVFLGGRLRHAENRIVVFVVHFKGAPPRAPRPPRVAWGPRARARSRWCGARDAPRARATTFCRSGSRSGVGLCHDDLCGA